VGDVIGIVDKIFFNR